MRRAAVGIAAALVILLVGHIAVAAQADAGAKRAGTQVNVNTATAEQLNELPGIGPAMAARIVEHRQKNGPFKKVEDLMNIRGIGEKNFLKLKPLVTVGTPKTSVAAPER